MPDRWTEEEGGVSTQQETQHKLDRPRMYRVLLHNDNYTTMDFVVMILVRVFRKPETQAIKIMLDVHQKGIGVVGVMPREIAETKVQQVTQLARDAQYPLLCTMEPE